MNFGQYSWGTGSKVPVFEEILIFYVHIEASPQHYYVQENVFVLHMTIFVVVDCLNGEIGVISIPKDALEAKMQSGALLWSFKTYVG